METELNPDEEPKEGQKSIPEKALVNHRGAYQKLTRHLSEEELNNPGTQKLLLSDLDRLQEEVNDLKQFRKNFHSTDKDKAVLEEQLKSSISKEVLYTVAISLGATFIGLSNSIWSSENNFGEVILLGGAVLIIGGLISKFFWK